MYVSIKCNEIVFAADHLNKFISYFYSITQTREKKNTGNGQTESNWISGIDGIHTVQNIQ